MVDISFSIWVRLLKMLTCLFKISTGIVVRVLLLSNQEIHICVPFWERLWAIQRTSYNYSGYRLLCTTWLARAYKLDLQGSNIYKSIVI